MGSAAASPPLQPPLLLLPLLTLLALAVCSLIGTAHALPQGSAADDAARPPQLGDPCSSAEDCASITQAECRDAKCHCLESHPIADSNECFKAAGLNQSCTVTAQCKHNANSICSSTKKCACNPKHEMRELGGEYRCLATPAHIAESKKTPVDPVMIGILVSLVLMFIIICIVLQLFSKARFRQNRTVLNSANPRLMNSSFLKGAAGKKGSAGGARGQRGSHSSLNTPPGDGLDTERPAAAGDPIQPHIEVS